MRRFSLERGVTGVMSRCATRKKFYPALLASVVYLVFLTSSAPHRVHHLFDARGQTHQAVGQEHAFAEPEHGPHRHEHGDRSHSHSADPTGQEEGTQGNHCILLAAFQQHPSSIAEPVLHTTTEHAVWYSFQPGRRLQSTTRVGLQRPRSPPKFQRSIL